MTLPLVLLRPEPGWSHSAAAARALGLTVTGSPLFTIETVAWKMPDAARYDGLLIGSANAIRHAGDSLDGLVALPVLAVGKQTAQAVRTAGLTVAQMGEGGLQSLLDTLVGQNLDLLHLRGEASVPLDPPTGIAVDQRIVYRSTPQTLDPDNVGILADGAVVALHSGEAARQFAAECDRLHIARHTIDIVALAPRIAKSAGPDWRSVHIADAPQDARLLALARHLCHTRIQG